MNTIDRIKAANANVDTSLARSASEVIDAILNKEAVVKSAHMLKDNDGDQYLQVKINVNVEVGGVPEVWAFEILASKKESFRVDARLNLSYPERLFMNMIDQQGNCTRIDLIRPGQDREWFDMMQEELDEDCPELGLRVL